MELATFRDLHPDLPISIEAVVTEDSPAELEKFLGGRTLPFPVSVDEFGARAAEYGVTDLPTSLFFDPEGKPLLVYDPITKEQTSKIVGARSWAGKGMTESLMHAVSR